MERATKNHITDTAIWEQLQRETRVHGDIEKAISTLYNSVSLKWTTEQLEHFNRGYTFLVGAKYARASGFSLDSAYRFGDHFTDFVMGNYTKGQRPMMYTNFGEVGHMASPFATIMNQYLGNMAHITKNLNPLQKPSVVAHAYISAGALGLSYLAFSGLQGEPLVEDYDWVARQWNDYNDDTHLPTWSDFLAKNNPPAALQFGIPSYVTQFIPGLEHGVNLGSSMNAPSIRGRVGVPTVPIAEAIASFGYSALKEAWSRLGGNEASRPTDKEAFKTRMSVAPTPFSTVIRNEYTTSGGTPVGSNIEHRIRFEPSDWVASALGGESLTVARERNKMNAMEQEARDFAKDASKAVENITDKITKNDISNETKKKLIHRAASDLKVDDSVINEAVNSHIKKQTFSWYEWYTINNKNERNLINESSFPQK